MNVHVSMRPHGNTVPYAVSGFVSMFNSMRPSERLKLRDIAKCDPDNFVMGLSVFLERWARNDWLEEYKVDRCARWLPKMCSPDLVEHIIQEVVSRAPANIGRGSSIAAQTYHVFLSRIRDV